MLKIASFLLHSLFFVAMLFGLGLAAAFAYFETSGSPWLIVAGAMLGLAALEAVKVTRMTHLADLWARRQWGRFAVNLLLWALLAASAFFMSFSAANDHLFGAVVDRIGSEAMQVAQWQSDIAEKRERRKAQVEHNGGEPLPEDGAKANLDQHIKANPKDWERSEQCAKVLPETRATCSKYEELHSALASASAVAGLDREIAALKAKVAAASPEAQMAAKSVSDEPRPRGLKALGMALGVVDRGKADLSVAYIALALTLAVEFVSNFLMYALEQRMPGAARAAPAAHAEPAPKPLPQAAGAPTSSSTPAPPRGPSGAPPKKQRGTPSRGTPRAPAPKAETRGLGQGQGNVVSLRKGDGAPPLKTAADFVSTLPREADRFYLSADFGAAFGAWCAGQGIDAPSDLTDFFVTLQSLGFRKHKRNGARGYIDERHLLAETA